ncbi:C-terminal binding protein [Pseudomonas sp. SWRI102]|uniref:C-terminal binding protein n=1 Tax=Pseudomonas marvdashtae TaxID=2745500 RepID=A0A923JPJ9_9PSED|nr:C-terminal binding protein [Pseudomonas marvdashtae]MBV4551294.1 C-terminal binding protein [Pseudomonas marvdashtae]
MNILMIDSRRANYVDAGEYPRESALRPYLLEVTSNPSDDQLAWADGVVAFHSVVIDKPLIAKMHRCRALVKATIGVDDVDIEALSAKGILLSNIGSVGVEEVAEHAMALILSAQRKLFDYAADIRRGGWDWRAHSGEVKACSDTVLGLIGYGATGRALAHRAAAMGYQVCYYDPCVERCVEDIAQGESLESLLSKADVISLHLPLTPDTRHLLNDRFFSRIKRGATLVNTARGAIVDTDALLRALKSGHVSTAMLDVLEEEPAPPQMLIDHERVVLTPHAAFYSKQSLLELKTNALSALLGLLRGERVDTVINPGCAQVEEKGYA